MIEETEATNQTAEGKERSDAGLAQQQYDALRLGGIVNRRTPEQMAEQAAAAERERAEFLADRVEERAAQARTAAIHAALVLETVRGQDADFLIAEARKIEAFLNGGSPAFN